jgi:hypothetical protein
VQANVWIKERVHAFPETLDLGVIRTGELKSDPQLIDLLAQSLMVYQVGGTDFHASAQTDVPFLALSVARSEFGDRCQITASVIPEKLKSGQVSGTIVVTTSDREFPRLTIPVRGSVEGDWR